MRPRIPRRTVLLSGAIVATAVLLIAALLGLGGGRGGGVSSSSPGGGTPAANLTTMPSSLAPSDAAATGSPLASGPVSGTIAPSPTISELQVSGVREVEVAAPPSGPTSCQAAFEPIVATHPSDANRLAVAYERNRFVGGRCAAVPALAISDDGERTWHDAPRLPWAGSGRAPDHHAAIAWGPGPRAGSARLYWADATVSSGTDAHLLSAAWSDDEGRTWSRLYTERRTPPWVGGFPDITVDRNPASPGYGNVYVAYNWLASATLGPGLRVLASADHGATWQAVEVPRAPAAAGYPASWRIGYRVRTGPDGALYVAAYQADLRHWDSQAIFSRGGVANVGRHGYTVTRLVLDRATRRFALGPTVMALTLPRNAYTVNQLPAPGTSANVYTDPMWQVGLDVDQSSGAVVLAAASYQSQSGPARPRGTVRVGRSTDGGRHWTAVTLPALPQLGGRVMSSYRPSVVAWQGRVVVGLHGLTDEPPGTSVARHLPVVVSAVVVSGDGGQSFGVPVIVSAEAWNAASLTTQISGPGLRDRIELTADARVVYAYGDGRLARPLPDTRAGRSAVYAALIALGP